MDQPTRAADLWQDPARARRRTVVDVVVATGYLATFGVLQSLATPAVTAWVAVALAVALAARRTWLPLMVAAAVLAGVLQIADGRIAVIADLACAPLAFTLGSHPSRVVRRLGLAGAVLTVAVAATWTGAVGSEQFRATWDEAVAVAALSAVVVLGGWIAGYARWHQHQAVQARMDGALAAAEQERLAGLYAHERERGRIAADMHDVVAHSWAVVAAQADGARYVLPTDPHRAEEALRVIGETARSAMNDVRGLLAELRDGEAPEAAVAPDVDQVIDRLRGSGLVVEHARHGTPADGPVAAAAGYVLTESLTNALKHGDDRLPVAVVEDWRDGCLIQITNAMPEGAAVGTGHGLTGMAARVADLGGVLAAEPRSGHWVVEARIPSEAGR